MYRPFTEFVCFWQQLALYRNVLKGENTVSKELSCQQKQSIWEAMKRLHSHSARLPGHVLSFAFRSFSISSSPLYRSSSLRNHILKISQKTVFKSVWSHILKHQRMFWEYLSAFSAIMELAGTFSMLVSCTSELIWSAALPWDVDSSAGVVVSMLLGSLGRFSLFGSAGPLQFPTSVPSFSGE